MSDRPQTNSSARKRAKRTSAVQENEPPSSRASLVRTASSPGEALDILADAATALNTPQDSLYSHTVACVIKEYGGQRSGVIKPPEVVIESTSIDEFKKKLFDLVKPHLEREIIVNPPNSNGDYTFEWGSKTKAELVADDLEKYVQLTLKDSNERTKLISTFNVNNYKHWRMPDKVVHVSVCKWSINVDNAKAGGQAHKWRMPKSVNRGGAPSNDMLNEVVVQLKEKHGSRYPQAFGVAWDLWANWILNQPAGDHDALINSPPPPQLCDNDNFPVAHVGGHRILQEQRAQNQVALGQNQRQLDFLHNVLTQSTNLANRANTLKRQAEELEHESMYLVSTVKRGILVQEESRALLQDGAQSLVAQQNNLSHQFLTVNDIPDDDH